MGKPFMSELHQLEATYCTALSMDISALNANVSDSLRYPLVAIGSGGSLTAAHFACHLHQMASGLLAEPTTPLEVVSLLDEPGSRRSLVNSAVICLSAGGSNADINHAWRCLIEAEPRQLMAICARTRSPLARISKEFDVARLFDFDLPSKKDGFLATNSLLASLILLGRAYGQLIDATTQQLPPGLWNLTPEYDSLDAALEDLRYTCREILERKDLIVLYGAEMEIAACDIESKFTEAALSSVHISDFRNFAHGRHHWLAKHGEQTAVIAFANDRDLGLARDTVRLIPPSVPAKVFHFPGGPVPATIGAVLTEFLLTGIAGEIRGFDPGRPGVPEFGRQLYHLGIGARGKATQCNEAPVRRKLAVCPMPPSTLVKANNTFCRSLRATTYSGLVLDYDGTLCGSENRFGALDSAIAGELIRLLRASILLGIATGRGKSVRESLRNALPKSLWKWVTVGYYNGAECAPLTDAGAPDGTSNACRELESVAQSLCSDPAIQSLATITIRKMQISVEPSNAGHVDALWGMIGPHVSRGQCIEMVHSGRSIDILAPGVTKRNVINAIKESCTVPMPAVLCIGDQGRWPGNDSDLLSEAHSLSVDTVSPDLKSCWNLAPAGYRGQQATLYYLKCLVPVGCQFRFGVARGGRA